MPRKLKRDQVETTYDNAGSVRAEDLPFDADDDIKSTLNARTPPDVGSGDDSKLPQAYYMTPPVYGDEADGDVSISSGGAGTELTYINDVTDMTADAGLGAQTINVRDASAFSAGQEVMLHQTQCYRDATKRFQYEFKRIDSVDGGSNTITFTTGLTKGFDSDSGGKTGLDTKTQVISVPNYNILTLNAGGGICPRPWDGFSGGILVFRAKTLQGGGYIQADDAGFLKSAVYGLTGNDRTSKGDGPFGFAKVFEFGTFFPTEASENYHSVVWPSADISNSVKFGGSGYDGNNTVTPSSVTTYKSTPYTKDGVNKIGGADLATWLPMSKPYHTHIRTSNGGVDFRVTTEAGSPRNLNTNGREQAAGSILCFVETHGSYTGTIRAAQRQDSPNAGGYVAFFSETNFTGTVEVDVTHSVDGVYGDNGTFYTGQPSANVEKGYKQGPRVVSSNAESSAGDILDREAGDERWNPLLDQSLDTTDSPTFAGQSLTAKQEITGSTEQGGVGEEMDVAEYVGDTNADHVLVKLLGILPTGQDYAEIMGGEDGSGQFGKGFIFKHNKTDSKYEIYYSSSGKWDGTETLLFEIDSSGNVLVAGRQKGAKGADVASATDITLGNGNYFDVTGTTTINTIAVTDWTAGSRVVLQFDASVTVTHNGAGTGASILLAGSVDFSATAGDTLELIYDGTTWREVSRTVI